MAGQLSPACQCWLFKVLQEHSVYHEHSRQLVEGDKLLSRGGGGCMITGHLSSAALHIMHWCIMVKYRPSCLWPSTQVLMKERHRIHTCTHILYSTRMEEFVFRTLLSRSNWNSSRLVLCLLWLLSCFLCPIFFSSHWYTLWTVG